MDISELLAERERLNAYGLHHALRLIDAEIERLSRSDTAAPAERRAPARTTTAATSPPDAAPVPARTPLVAKKRA